jgi:EpsD family peptidyl-prolyl cis-trans isomerase
MSIKRDCKRFMNDQEKCGAFQSTRRRRVRTSIVMVFTLAALGGCQKRPGGQVLAVVDNEEITQQELRAEGQVSPTVAGQNEKAATAGLLENVINRNLLAAYARSEGLDRGPDYVIRRRQLDQALLASLAMQKITGPDVNPTPAEIQQFIQSQPTLFARRERLTLDQIRISTPAEIKQIQVLTTLPSIDAIALKLTGDGVAFERSSTVVDTGALDPSIAKQIVVLPDGEIFDLSTSGMTFISRITDRANAATPPPTWTEPAAAAVRRIRVEKSLATSIANLRKNARIDYDSAFKPKSSK